MRRLTILTVLGMVLGLLGGFAPVSADEANFEMGNVDRAGSRSLPGYMQGDLTAAAVRDKGLEVQWTAPTSSSVAGAPVTFESSVIVGDFAGFVYAFDRSDGSTIWQTCVEAVGCPGPAFFFSGILGSPLVKDDTAYIGTLSGSMVALNAYTGEILWTHTPQVTPPAFGVFPIDSVWGGPIVVRNMVIYALAPNDEFGLGVYGRGAVLAVDRHTGEEIWRRPLIGDSDFAAGSSGAAVWNTTPTYSPELDYVFVGTGQDTNPAPGDAGSDSFFAIDASDGSIAWQTQVRTGDTWNVAVPFDPLNPTDTDIGDSPAVFRMRGQLMVAAGDKRGIFWVLDAATGEILNNAGAGLDLFGGNLPGPGLTGGFNLDAGYIKSGNTIRHFAVFADQTTSLQEIVDTTGTCIAFSPGGCPIEPDTGNLVILNGIGTEELCRFSAAETELFSPLHLGGMILVRGAQDATVYAVDSNNCDLIAGVPVPTGPSGGANLSVANGTIYTGGGYLGAPGLTAIGIGD